MEKKRTGKRGRYAGGGGVLGAFGRAAAPRMQLPARPDPIPALRTADRTIGRAGPALRALRRAKGGTVSTLLGALARKAKPGKDVSLQTLENLVSTKGPKAARDYLETARSSGLGDDDYYRFVEYLEERQ